MMRIAFILYLFTYSISLLGQQDNLITQFNFNKLSFNPGVAGINSYTKITALLRDQWTGLDGSPQTQLLTVNFPNIINRIGFGLQLQRQSIGIQSKTDLTGMYAYHIKLAEGYASVGLQLSYRNFVNDFTDTRLLAINGFQQDPSITQQRYSRNIFNVGIGGYYKGPNYFFGFSIPRIIRADIDFDLDSFIAKEVYHYYATAGVSIILSNDWTLSPSVLFKTAESSPYDLDLMAMMTYSDKLHMGINIRTGGSQQSIVESIDFILGLQLSEKIFASIAYDFTTTQLSSYENGSFEVLLQYNLKKHTDPKEIQNPRYFQ